MENPKTKKSYNYRKEKNEKMHQEKRNDDISQNALTTAFNI